MGDYQTNCYIVSIGKTDIIIDPGVGASSWVKENVSNPLAILNTHGHFDHVWSNQDLKKYFNIPIYCPKDDCFMLDLDLFDTGVPSSKADFKVEPDELVSIGDFKVKFWHFSGHTPGCSALQIEDALFSGDFLFKNSIGRVDFPYSNPSDMRKSIEKIMMFEDDLRLYPGHGAFSNLDKEKENLPAWLRHI